MKVVKKVLAVVGGVVFLLIATLNFKGQVVHSRVVMVPSTTAKVEYTFRQTDCGFKNDTQDSIVAFRQTATKIEETIEEEKAEEEKEKKIDFPLFSEWYFDPIQQYLK